MVRPYRSEDQRLCGVDGGIHQQTSHQSSDRKGSISKNPDQLLRDRFARGAFAMFYSIGLLPGVALAMPGA